MFFSSWKLFRYYEGLQKCVGLHSESAEYSSNEIEQLEALYKSLGQQYSWSSAVKVIYSVFVNAPFYLSFMLTENPLAWNLEMYFNYLVGKSCWLTSRLLFVKLLCVRICAHPSLTKLLCFCTFIRICNYCSVVISPFHCFSSSGWS